jgi:effector-binding domain-containing protein
MLIEAIVEKGQVRLLKPIQFKHDYFVVKVDVPDNEIVPCRQDIETDNPLLNQTEEVAEFKRLTDDLFGQGYYYLPEKTDQKILAEVLSENCELTSG